MTALHIAIFVAIFVPLAYLDYRFVQYAWKRWGDSPKLKTLIGAFGAVFELFYALTASGWMHWAGYPAAILLTWTAIYNAREWLDGS